MRGAFLPFFKQLDKPTARGKFLARVFGYFSEEIVRIWAADERASYEDLGRPTLFRPEEKRGSTLDFCFRSRQTGKVFVAELKCEIEYQGYRYLLLEQVDRLRHHAKPAFNSFLRLARGDGVCTVTVAGRQQAIDGAVLIWGAASAQGRLLVQQETGIHDVLTMEEIIADLQQWENAEYLAFLNSGAHGHRLF